MDYQYEQQQTNPVVGIDEVGRGPWAGSVVAAAVLLNPQYLPLTAQDSKKLSPTKRQELSEYIHTHHQVGIGEASVEEIDRLNIRQATFLAMERALAQLNPPPNAFLAIDGRDFPDCFKNFVGEAVIKGDSKVLSIACASIVAKVYRDEMMTRLSQQYPHYGWERNAGYGTKLHQSGLQSHGITEYHRKSFRPIRELL